MNRCRFDGCTTVVLPGIARCETHRLRWLPGQSAERVVEPEWLRRRRTDGLPAKDYTGRAA